MAMKLIVPNIRIAAKIIKKILKRTPKGFLTLILLLSLRKEHLLKANPLTPTLSPLCGGEGKGEVIKKNLSSTLSNIKKILCRFPAFEGLSLAGL
jgi:hypothetical protein